MPEEPHVVCEAALQVTQLVATSHRAQRLLLQPELVTGTCSKCGSGVSNPHKKMPTGSKSAWTYADPDPGGKNA